MDKKLTCPMCGGEVTVDTWQVTDGWYTWFVCKNVDCGMEVNYKLRLEAAIKRFTTRPESVWKKAFKTLKINIEVLKERFEKSANEAKILSKTKTKKIIYKGMVDGCLECLKEVVNIEKELKHE